MARVFISVGSNLGDRAQNCLEALRALERGGVRVVKLSRLYETSPWGSVDQPPFVNCAAEVETELPPLELLKAMKKAEMAAGRRSFERWGPREADLDIIFYSDLVFSEGGLEIPHPRAHERAFVLVPLSEIAPDFIHPALKKSVKELKDSLKDQGWVRRVED